MDDAELLIDLLEAYSPSGQEDAAVGRFLDIAAGLGYAVERDAVGNGIARRGSGRPQTVFLGHIDTVEGALPVRREGARVFGRGACDAKGPLLAALLAGHRAPPRGELVIVAAVGEETDSRGARAIFDTFDPEYVIAGEPSGWDGLVIGYKGDLRLRATFTGARAHLSSPSPSITDRALAWIAAIRRQIPLDPAATPFRSLTMKVVSVRTETDGGAEEVEAIVDLRIPPGTRAASLLATLPREGAPDRVTPIAQIDPFEGSRTDPLASALADGIRACGGRPTFWRRGGTSDLNLVAPAWGVRGVAYGPGDSHLDHTDGEFLELAELDRSIRVLAHTFATLAAGAVTPRGSVDGP